MTFFFTYVNFEDYLREKYIQETNDNMDDGDDGFWEWVENVPVENIFEWADKYTKHQIEVSKQKEAVHA